MNECKGAVYFWLVHFAEQKQVISHLFVDNFNEFLPLSILIYFLATNLMCNKKKSTSFLMFQSCKFFNYSKLVFQMFGFLPSRDYPLLNVTKKQIKF